MTCCWCCFASKVWIVFATHWRTWQMKASTLPLHRILRWSLSCAWWVPWEWLSCTASSGAHQRRRPRERAEGQCSQLSSMIFSFQEPFFHCSLPLNCFTYLVIRDWKRSWDQLDSSELLESQLVCVSNLSSCHESQHCLSQAQCRSECPHRRCLVHCRVR